MEATTRSAICSGLGSGMASGLASGRPRSTMGPTISQRGRVRRMLPSELRLSGQQQLRTQVPCVPVSRQDGAHVASRPMHRPSPPIAQSAAVALRCRHGFICDRSLGAVRAPRVDVDPGGAPACSGLRRLPQDRGAVGAPTRMPHMRPRRLLRFFAEPARDQALPRHAPSDRQLGRGRRDLGVVLRR